MIIGIILLLLLLCIIWKYSRAEHYGINNRKLSIGSTPLREDDVDAKYIDFRNRYKYSLI